MSEKVEKRQGPNTVEIPADWEMEEIGELFEPINGRVFDKDEWSNTGKPIIRIQNLTKSSGADIKYADIDVDEKYHVENGDLLYCWAGYRGASFGAYLWDGAKAYLNQHIFNLNPIQDVRKRFFLYSLNHYTHILESLAVGAARQVHITKSDFKKFPIPTPSPEEQERIASVLYAVDQKIEALHERRKWLEQHKQGLMQDLLTGDNRVTPEMGIDERIVPSPSKIVENRNWEEKKFEDLFIIKSESYRPDEHDEMVFHYSMPAFDEGEPIKEHTSNIGSTKRIVPDETILFPKLNIRKKRFWFVNRETELPKICSTEYWPLLPKSGEDVFLPFYHQYFQSDKFCDSPLLSTSSSTNSHQRVKRNLVKLEELPVPPLWEQERITSVLYTVDEMIEKTQNLIDEHERLKTGLMQDLLSGDVRTPDDLPVMDDVKA